MELRENDFYYVMQDTSHIYVGARITYFDLGEHHDTPLKLRSAIYRVIINEFSLEDRVSDHLLDLTPSTKTYMIYDQLAVKIKVCFFQKKVDKKGRECEEYISKTYSIKELTEDAFLKEYPESYVIQELSFSKRKLLMLAI